ncbi:hypothetical protein DFA_06129 [Cavenderia fasciculata]|uniref:Ankyrin repeat-containing protein n=1 Tax=Cavenderia fasciculata TaxID=261658 RepID=F4PK67_CACFS|nr:uncharacterized protein DFA_06129 [Cavenderia fasciculata]EGG23991.1 hypothetical protein DFA_06129 [Cavenderia fasciculata]|eukprot:XP_004361842.1 hypothetical protein DFA_06129 [Cavenderia fasciculata]
MTNFSLTKYNKPTILKNWSTQFLPATKGVRNLESKYTRNKIFNYVRSFNKIDNGRGRSIRYQDVDSLGWLLSVKTKLPSLLREKILKSVEDLCFPSYNAILDLCDLDLDLFKVVYQHFKMDGIDRYVELLDRASERGRLDIAEYLISQRHPMSTRAIEEAVANGHLEVVKLLLDCDYIQDAPAQKFHPREPAYQRAAISGHLHVLQYLDSIKPKYPFQTNASIISRVCESDREDIVRYLFDHRKDILFNRRAVIDGAMGAIGNCNPSLLTFLKSIDPLTVIPAVVYEIYPYSEYKLIPAVEKGDPESFKAFMDMGVFGNQLHPKCIPYAIASGSLDLVKLLLTEYREFIHPPLPSSSYTIESVGAACQTNNLDMVKLVMENMRTSEPHPRSLLSFATKSGNKEIIEYVYHNTETIGTFGITIHFSDLDTIKFIHNLLRLDGGGDGAPSYMFEENDVIKAFSYHDIALMNYLLDIRPNILFSMRNALDSICYSKETAIRIMTSFSSLNEPLGYRPGNMGLLNVCQHGNLDLLRHYIDVLVSEGDGPSQYMKNRMFTVAIISKHLHIAQYVHDELGLIRNLDSDFMDRILFWGDQEVLEYVLQNKYCKENIKINSNMLRHASHDLETMKCIFRFRKGTSVVPEMIKGAITTGHLQMVRFLESKLPKNNNRLAKYILPDSFDGAIERKNVGILMALKEHFLPIIKNNLLSESIIPAWNEIKHLMIE